MRLSVNALLTAVAIHLPVAANCGPLAAQGLGIGATRPSEPRSVVVPVAVDSASPRASMTSYLGASRAGDFARAATWLDLGDPAFSSRGPELARRLKTLLDAKLWVDLELVSPVAVGDTTDGLPADREQLGAITAADGVAHPIRLARTQAGSAVRWVFSASTVASVDELYAALPDYWIREHLPIALLMSGPFDVLRWQWIALLLLLPVASLIGWVLAPLTQSLMRRAVARTDTDLDDKLVASAHGPLVLLWGVAASRVLLRWIALATPAEAFVHALQRGTAVAAGFWIVLRGIGVLQHVLPVSSWATRHQALRSLVPLGARIARLLVFVLGVLTVIATFGYPVATILAGLGIGGIAVALGAQKSLEHFFGSVSIGVDQPFRVGDWIAAEGIEGEVEAIGLRSTRIRTMDRTLVSIPNGRLSEVRSENFGERERVRFRTTVGLEYGTAGTTIRQVRDGIEALLRAHPKTWAGRVVVRFAAFNTSSLDIEVFCWIETREIDEFRAIREEMLLGIMDLVERSGASFAFPTQTVHLRKEA